jgi:hypothetical protein
LREKFVAGGAVFIENGVGISDIVAMGRQLSRLMLEVFDGKPA